MGAGFLHSKKGGVDTSDANAAAGDLLTGKSAYVNDQKVNGSMPNRAGDTACLASSVSGTTLKLRASDGYRDGSDDNVTITDADFIAAKIKNGENIFGLAGDYKGYLHGTLTITGTYASSTYYTAANCVIGSNIAEGLVLVVMRGGTTTSYENMYFAAGTLPDGVSLVAYTSSSSDTSNGSQQFFGFYLTGVTGILNVTVNLDTVNSTYDTVRGTVSAAYA